MFSNPVEQVMREYAENSEFGRNNSRLLIKKNEYNCNFFLPKMRRENLYHERYIKKIIEILSSLASEKSLLLTA